MTLEKQSQGAPTPSTHPAYVFVRLLAQLRRQAHPRSFSRPHAEPATRTQPISKADPGASSAAVAGGADRLNLNTRRLEQLLADDSDIGIDAAVRTVLRSSDMGGGAL